MRPNVGDKVQVAFEIEVTDVESVKDFPERAFICGNVILGEHEPSDNPRLVEKKMEAYVNGVPLSAIVQKNLAV